MLLWCQMQWNAVHWVVEDTGAGQRPVLKPQPGDGGERASKHATDSWMDTATASKPLPSKAGIIPDGPTASPATLAIHYPVHRERRDFMPAGGAKGGRETQIARQLEGIVHTQTVAREDITIGGDRQRFQTDGPSVQAELQSFRTQLSSVQAAQREQREEIHRLVQAAKRDAFHTESRPDMAALGLSPEELQVLKRLCESVARKGGIAMHARTLFRCV